MEFFDFCFGEASCYSFGVDSCGEEGFVGVDIADSGDEVLVEEESFYISFLGEHFGECFKCKSWFEWF